MKAVINSDLEGKMTEQKAAILENLKISDFELLKLYYDLGGLAWNCKIKLVTMPNKDAALKFLAAAPGWTVQYIARTI